MRLYLYSVVNVLASNGYLSSSKVGFPQVQQCMLYLYPQLLQSRVYICRRESSTLFSLYTFFTCLRRYGVVFPPCAMSSQYLFNEAQKQGFKFLLQLMKEIAQGTRIMEMVGLSVSLLSLSISLFIFCYYR